MLAPKLSEISSTRNVRPNSMGVERLLYDQRRRSHTKYMATKRARACYYIRPGKA